MFFCCSIQLSDYSTYQFRGLQGLEVAYITQRPNTRIFDCVHSSVQFSNLINEFVFKKNFKEIPIEFSFKYFLRNRWNKVSWLLSIEGFTANFNFCVSPFLHKNLLIKRNCLLIASSGLFFEQNYVVNYLF